MEESFFVYFDHFIESNITNEWLGCELEALLRTRFGNLSVWRGLRNGGVTTVPCELRSELQAGDMG